jgi:hypothetical protein
MIIVRHKNADTRSWIDMVNYPNLHISNAIVIVYVNKDREKSGIGHDQFCKKPTTKRPFVPLPADQTP